MTIEDLAVMTQKGFLELGTELRKEMREGFKAVDIRLSDLEKRIASLEADFKDIRQNLFTKLDVFVGIMKKQD